MAHLYHMLAFIHCLSFSIARRSFGAEEHHTRNRSSPIVELYKRARITVGSTSDGAVDDCAAGTAGAAGVVCVVQSSGHDGRW